MARPRGEGRRARARREDGGRARFVGRDATFSYVVEPKKEGDIDLGEIALSFYDPRAKAYDVARAPLGVVHVKPGVAAAAVGRREAASRTCPACARRWDATRSAERHLDDSNVFWGLLAMPSVLFGARARDRDARREACKERAAERKASPVAELKQRLRAVERGDRRRRSARDRRRVDSRARGAARRARERERARRGRRGDRQRC